MSCLADEARKQDKAAVAIEYYQGTPDQTQLS